MGRMLTAEGLWLLLMPFPSTTKQPATLASVETSKTERVMDLEWVSQVILVLH